MVSVGFVGLMVASFFSVHVAAGDRSIRTPTSRVATSTAQDIEQSEEDGLPRVPGQQPIHQPTARAEEPTRYPPECIHKRLELHRQDRLLFAALPLCPAPWLFGKLQRQPG